MRRPIVIAATVLACAATAAPARADGMGKDIAYAVRVDGSGTYAYTGSDDVSLRFTYSGSIGDGVVFRNASPFDTTGQDIPVATATGTYGSGCTVDQGFPPAHGRMRFLDADEELVPLDGSVHMWLRPLDALQVQFACPGDEDVHPSVDIALPTADDAYEPDGTVKLGQNPFDIAFDVPRDIIGMGSIQQLDPARTIEGVRCPATSRTRPSAASCSGRRRSRSRSCGRSRSPARRRRHRHRPCSRRIRTTTCWCRSSRTARRSSAAMRRRRRSR